MDGNKEHFGHSSTRPDYQTATLQASGSVSNPAKLASRHHNNKGTSDPEFQHWFRKRWERRMLTDKPKSVCKVLKKKIENKRVMAYLQHFIVQNVDLSVIPKKYYLQSINNSSYDLCTIILLKTCIYFGTQLEPCTTVPSQRYIVALLQWRQATAGVDC